MIISTAGTRIYIGSAVPLKLADFIASDFAAQPWVEILSHEDLGSIGDVATELEVKQVLDYRTKRLKGRRSSVTMELRMTLDPEDTGQVAIIAAEKVNSSYAFRIVLPDAPAGGTGSERLFIAAVGGLTEQFDDSDAVMKVNASLWVNSNVVRVAAAEAD